MRRQLADKLAVLVVAFALGTVAASQLSKIPEGSSAPRGGSAEFNAPSLSVPLSAASIIVIGDSGSGDGNQLAVADAIASTIGSGSVAALVMTGDNVYPEGSPARFRSVLDDPYRPWLGPAPIVATLGNHDVQDGHGEAQLEHLKLPALPYRRAVGEIEFFVLDANNPNTEQSAWLDAALSSSSARFTVVVFHQPAYSCSKHGSTPAVQEHFVPVLEARRVTLTLSGHDHNYQRFIPSGGVTYVVTGGGGAKLYPITACRTPDSPQVAASAHHFLILTPTLEGLALSAVDLDGRVLDHVVLTPKSSPTSR